jgi:hypothetical protein
LIQGIGDSGRRYKEDHPLFIRGIYQRETMLKTLKKYMLWALLGGGFYFLMSHHIIFYGRDFRLLEKSTLSLEYTFYSLKDKKMSNIMKIDALREDGIGDLLVDFGLLTEEEKISWEQTYEDEYVDDDT